MSISPRVQLPVGSAATRRTEEVRDSSSAFVGRRSEFGEQYTSAITTSREREPSDDAHAGHRLRSVSHHRTAARCHSAAQLSLEEALKILLSHLSAIR